MFFDSQAFEDEPMPEKEPERQIWTVRKSALQNCVWNMSLLLSEKEMRGRYDPLHRLFNYHIGSKEVIATVLETLHLSGDLVPLSEFSGVTTIIEKPTPSHLKLSRKELVTEEIRRGKQGITPLSEAKDYIVDKVNALLGRPKIPKIFVVTRALNFIAERAVAMLRKESRDEMRTRKGLMLRETLKSFYSRSIPDPLTRSYLHIHLTSHDLIKSIHTPGKPDVVRVMIPGESLPGPEDLEHFWLQTQRLYTESEKHRRTSAQKRIDQPWLTDEFYELLGYNKHDELMSRHDDPGEMEKLRRLTDTELEERLKELKELIRHLDAKHYQEHPEDWEKQIVLAAHEGDDHITPDINLIHQIFSTASPVAPQLWNIYQFLNRAMRHFFHELPPPGPGDPELNSVNDIVSEILFDAARISNGVNMICVHAIMHPELVHPQVLNPNPPNPDGAIDGQANIAVVNPQIANVGMDIANPGLDNANQADQANLGQVNPHPINPGLVNPEPDNPGLVNPEPDNLGLVIPEPNNPANPNDPNEDDPNIDTFRLASCDPDNPQLINMGLAAIALAIHIQANSIMLDPDRRGQRRAPLHIPGRREIQPTTVAETIHNMANNGLIDHGLREADLHPYDIFNRGTVLGAYVTTVYNFVLSYLPEMVTAAHDSDMQDEYVAGSESMDPMHPMQPDVGFQLQEGLLEHENEFGDALIWNDDNLAIELVDGVNEDAELGDIVDGNYDAEFDDIVDGNYENAELNDIVDDNDENAELNDIVDGNDEVDDNNNGDEV